MKKVALGIDIGGTNTAIGVVDQEGNVIYVKSPQVPTPKKEENPNGDKAMRELKRVLKEEGKLLLVDFDYPRKRNLLGYLNVKLWEKLGDIIKDINFLDLLPAVVSKVINDINKLLADYPEKTKKMNRMIVAVFDNETKAFEGLTAMKELHKNGDISLYASAVINKNEAGEIALKSAAEKGPIGMGVGMLSGAFIGLLAGPIGMAVGAMAGSMGGMIYDLDKTGVDTTFVEEVAVSLKNGKTAVIADVDEGWNAPIDTRMDALDAMVFRRNRAEVADEQLERNPVTTAGRASIRRPFEARIVRIPRRHRGDARAPRRGAHGRQRVPQAHRARGGNPQVGLGTTSRGHARDLPRGAQGRARSAGTRPRREGLRSAPARPALPALAGTHATPFLRVREREGAGAEHRRFGSCTDRRSPRCAPGRGSLRRRLCRQRLQRLSAHVLDPRQ